MKSFINDKADNWGVDLTEDSTLSQFMPMLNFTLVNTGDSKVEIYMHGQRIGSCFGYSVFSLIGKPFETFRVTGTFNIGDIEVIVSKMVTVAVMPYNPQIDLMEENLDKFASGTDKRISYSSTISAESIKYILNVQGGLVVQRKLDVLGGASVGSYEIDFNGDIVGGSTAINFPSIDLKRYKKTITSGTFDYTLTNCIIKGWMLDYKEHTRPPGTTSIATNPDNAIDGDMSTYANIESSEATPPFDIWMIELDTAQSVTELHFSGYIEDDWLHDNTAHHQILTSPNGSDWTERGATDNTGGAFTYYKHITGLGLSDIKYVKVQDSNGYLTQKLYDVSIIS